MQIESSISVGVGRVAGGPDRVTLITNNSRITLSTEFARHIAVQLIMWADFIDNTEEQTERIDAAL